MKSEDEILEMRNKFENSRVGDDDDEEQEAIISALNWVLEDSNDLETYIPV